MLDGAGGEEVGDAAPEGGIRMAVWIIVREAREEDELRGGGGLVEVAGHLRREEAVAVTVQQECRNATAGERLLGAPDGRDEEGRDAEAAGGVAEGGKRGAEDEALGGDAGLDAGGDAAAEREAEDGGGQARGETAEMVEGGDGVVLALRGLDAAAALAVAGVVEDERGDAELREQVLDGSPVVDGLADAVAEEQSRARFYGGGLREDGVDGVAAAGDGVPGEAAAGGVGCGDVIEEQKEAAGEGDAEGEHALLGAMEECGHGAGRQDSGPRGSGRSRGGRCEGLHTWD